MCYFHISIKFSGLDVMKLNEIQLAALQAAATMLAGKANFLNPEVSAAQCVALAEEILKTLEEKSGDEKSQFGSAPSYLSR
jgi:hypothetical protein